MQSGRIDSGEGGLGQVGGQTGFAVSLEVGRGTSLAAALALLDLANDLALVHFLEGLHHALPLGDLV